MEDVCIWVLRRQKSAEIVKDCKTYYCHCKISVSSLLLPSCLSSSWRIALKSSMLQLNGFFQEREELLQSPQCCCSSMGISKSLKNCSKVLNGLFQELQRTAPHPECCWSMDVCSPEYGQQSKRMVCRRWTLQQQQQQHKEADSTNTSGKNAVPFTSLWVCPRVSVYVWILPGCSMVL